MLDKIESAIDILNSVAKSYGNPIVYCGFGKDSLAMLHLIREAGYSWPIMCHRDYEFPRKWRYAHAVMERWGLSCYDYPPRMCSIMPFSDMFCVGIHYGVGNQDLIFPDTLYKPERYIEGEYLCALNDVYLQPKCHGYDYRWDVGLMASRAAELKPHGNGKSLTVFTGQSFEIKRNIGSVDFAFPLWSWTEEDIYNYFIEKGIPINTDVYDVKDGRMIPKTDPSFDPDRRPACFECMMPDNPVSVFCPKMMRLVNNVSDSLVTTTMPNGFPSTATEQKGE